MKCCICKKEIKKKGSQSRGSNAEPLKKGKCCDNCNTTKVIPARLALIGGKK